jgi:basic amino acid/polyamine antiporter, APA family
MRPAPALSPGSPSLRRELGLLGVAALVFGNMVGTSIYTLPATLAEAVGPLGLIAWLLTALGYFFVARVYAELGPRYPRTGGPYVFVREAFGDRLAFQTAWCYWLSATLGNAGIVTGVVGYATSFSPLLAGSAGLRFALAQSLLWGLCLLNVVGVRHGARLQVAILFLNLTPLLVLCALSLPAFDATHLEPFAPRGWSQLPIGAALIVWAYSGVESATVPAEEVRDPRTIRRGTLLGYALATLVFLLASVAVVGALPNGVIASSAQPIALAARESIGKLASAQLGSWAFWAISYAAIAAGLGTLNGWILLAGRIPVSAAKDGLFFRGLARVHPRFQTPHVALLAGCAISSLTLCLYFLHSLLEVFELIVLLSVLWTLIPHLLVMASEWKLSLRPPVRSDSGRAKLGRARVVAALAFVYVLFTICGVCFDPRMLWGFLAIPAGVALDQLLRRRAARQGSR